MGVLLPYTAHDLNAREGKLTIIVWRELHCLVGISHWALRTLTCINPGSATILYSLHKIVPVFGRMIGRKIAAAPLCTFLTSL